MAAALVQVNVIDIDSNPLFAMLIHSSNINLGRFVEDGVTNLTYFDPYLDRMQQVFISESVGFLGIQSGMMLVTAIGIDGQVLDNETIAIQEFHINSVAEVIDDDLNYRLITYNEEGNNYRFISVTETLDELKNQTSQSSSSVGAIISPVSGTYTTNTQLVTMSSNITGASIYYTTNGTTPTTSSTLYTAPFSITINTIVKAIATFGSFPSAGVVTSNINIKLLPPTASPNGGVFEFFPLVTLSTPVAGTSIYYTTDGSTPTTGSTLYSSPFTMSTSFIKALATRTNNVNSNVFTSLEYFLTQSLWMVARGTAGSALRVSNNGGSTWTGSNPSSSAVNYNSVAGTTGAVRLFAALSSTAQGFYYSTTQGSSWTKTTDPTLNLRYDGVAASLDGDNLICHSNYDFSITDINIYRSINGGATLTTLSIGGFTVAKRWTMPCCDETGDIMFVAGTMNALDNGTEGAWLSTDTGATWTKVIATANQAISRPIMSKDGVYILAPYTNLAGVFQSIYFSSNGGTTFTSLIGVPTLTFLCGSNDGQFVYGAASTGSIYKSTDYGQTYSAITTPSYINTINGIECSPTGESILFTTTGASGQLWRSVDEGVSWSNISASFPAVASGGFSGALSMEA
jgi:photosystem II stability/assembly factor-like uncharacterized protein